MSLEMAEKARDVKNKLETKLKENVLDQKTKKWFWLNKMEPAGVVKSYDIMLKCLNGDRKISAEFESVVNMYCNA